MKITKIDVLQVKAADGRPGWRPVLARVHTDEGIYGDGEAALAYGAASSAAFGAVKDFAALIIGDDPLGHEVIWNKLYKTTFWGQNGGPVIFAAISAIDIALWDIKGKALGQPVYKLLGGKFREDLRAYASQLQFGWHGERRALGATAEYAAVTKEALAEGYDAVKIDFFTYDRDARPFRTEEQSTLLSPYYLDLIEERVAAVREAAGPGTDIIAENHSNPNANSAVQIGRRIRKYNIFYFEEPNTPTPKLAKVIGDRIGIPIAHGERVYSRWQFFPYFENSSVQIIQPDLGNTGGITEGKKIADAAYTYDVNVQAHVCGSPLATAAALHFEAAIPNFVIHEHHRSALLRHNKDLAIHDYQPVNGRFKVPELPGLGNEISEKAFAQSERVTVK
jgi:L-alanine-DL-glutamate epimerase-like enolase superfamily enzyme